MVLYSYILRIEHACSRHVFLLSYIQNVNCKYDTTAVQQYMIITLCVSMGYFSLSNPTLTPVLCRINARRRDCHYSCSTSSFCQPGVSSCGCRPRRGTGFILHHHAVLPLLLVFKTKSTDTRIYIISIIQLLAETDGTAGFKRTD